MPTTHTMRLNAVPFEATKAGLKTIEVRLNDDKRRTISLGDILKFEKTGEAEILRAKVLSIRAYTSLGELTSNESFLKTGGIYPDVAAWIAAINTYYSIEEQSRFGLLCIEVTLI